MTGAASRNWSLMNALRALCRKVGRRRADGDASTVVSSRQPASTLCSFRWFLRRASAAAALVAGVLE